MLRQNTSRNKLNDSVIATTANRFVAQHSMIKTCERTKGKAVSGLEVIRWSIITPVTRAYLICQGATQKLAEAGGNHPSFIPDWKSRFLLLHLSTDFQMIPWSIASDLLVTNNTRSAEMGKIVSMSRGHKDMLQCCWEWPLRSVKMG